MKQMRMTPTQEPIIVEGKWKVREMVLTKEKLSALWEEMQKYTTLFSDLTRGDPDNFVRLVMQPSTLWYEVWEGDEDLVGVLWVSELEEIVDVNVHMIYFDRKPAEKHEVSQQVIWWIFKHFPIHRMTASPPALYHATIRLMKRLGFVEEGRKRQSILIGGKWNDQVIYGLTRPEVEAQWASSQVE